MYVYIAWQCTPLTSEVEEKVSVTVIINIIVFFNTDPYALKAAAVTFTLEFHGERLLKF